MTQITGVLFGFDNMFNDKINFLLNKMRKIPKILINLDMLLPIKQVK